jgi:hypothetical protein
MKFSLAFLTIFLIFLSYLNGNKMKSKTSLTISSTKCNPLCLECSDGDFSICKVCKTGVYQYNNQCFNKCPEGTYADLEWQVCRECDSACPICWGPMSDMCGTFTGIKSFVVLLENEIKVHLQKNGRNYSTREIEKNLLDLKILLTKLSKDKKIDIDKLQSMKIFKDDTLSPEDVYSSNKIELELPLGAFSKNDGVFLPIPSYLSKEMELIYSHWIFVKGMWNGHTWLDNWFPKLPTFIKLFGDKNKLYYENGGYWIHDRVSNGIYNLIF